MINQTRLQKLIDFLILLEPNRFNFNKVWDGLEDAKGGCGSCGCAMGWTPTLFPDLVQRTVGCYATVEMVDDSDKSYGYERVAQRLFNMDSETARFLFSPEFQSWVHEELPNCGMNAKPAEVAEMLTQYLELVNEGRIDDN